MTDDIGNEKRMVSTGEAAEVLGISVSTVRRWIASGQIEAVVVKGDYLIAYDSIVRPSPAPSGDLAQQWLEARLAGIAAQLTIAEAAALLGEEPWTIGKWARTGDIPVNRFGKSVRIPTAALIPMLLGMAKP